MNALSTIHVPASTARLSHFVNAISDLLGEVQDEPDILARGRPLLEQLVAEDDWLPDSHAAPDRTRYQQYLLYRDPAGRFSVVSFVWGPGQATPVHDHRVWGLIGVLRGAELVENFVRDPQGAIRRTGEVHVLDAGEVDAVSPTVGDIHRVANAYDHRVSISIHLYGADIGTVQRATYDRSGQAKPFVSGYADVPALIA